MALTKLNLGQVLLSKPGGFHDNLDSNGHILRFYPTERQTTTIFTNYVKNSGVKSHCGNSINGTRKIFENH